MNVRVRFPPSPTGFLHVGGLRTALYNYLFARKMGGTFIMRIEDTDRERFVEGGTENMVCSLKWAGLTIDEGVNLDNKGSVIQIGDKGPYIQSERLAIYQKHTNELIANGHAYYCFCTKERLDELRKFQELNKLPPGYDGHCRNLNAAEAEARKNRESFVIRMKMPLEGSTTFVDLIRGEISFVNKLIDDQVLVKSDGFPTYHLAVVVDDHLMEITHAIRGEEWLSSTPKHLELHRMFGWQPPAFGHLSLLVNEQKQKLSKRHGDVSVEDFKEKGYLPEALVNFVAFLGWNPGDEREIFTLKELEREFSLEKVSKPAAVFNREKLNWYNQHYLRSLNPTELVARAEPFLAAQFPNYAKSNPRPETELDNWLADLLALEQARATTLVDLVSELGFIFNEPDPKAVADILVWKKSTPGETKKIIGDILDLFKKIPEESWNAAEIDRRLRAYVESTGLGVGNVYWPVRVALSGQTNSPGPTEIAGVLGKAKTLSRLKKI